MLQLLPWKQGRWTLHWPMTGKKEHLYDIKSWKGEVMGGDKDMVSEVTAIGKMDVAMKNDDGEESVIEVAGVRLVKGYTVTLI